MNCDRCGGGTTPKQITSKKNGQTYTVFECQGTCMNGQYKYSMFAPRAPKAKSNATPQSGEVVTLLTKILSELQSIRMMVNGKTTLANDPIEKEIDMNEGAAPF